MENKKLYNTFQVIRNNNVILTRTYKKPKTENQLRHYAVSLMVKRDMALKWSFYIKYLNI